MILFAFLLLPCENFIYIIKIILNGNISFSFVWLTIYVGKPVDVFVGGGLEGTSHRITSLSFSPEGHEILVSYSSEHLYLFDLKVSLVTSSFKILIEIQLGLSINPALIKAYNSIAQVTLVIT